MSLVVAKVLTLVVGTRLSLNAPQVLALDIALILLQVSNHVRDLEILEVLSQCFNCIITFFDSFSIE